MLPFVVVISFLAAGTLDLERHEWPQWGGARRNFVAQSPDLADSWPPEGPRRLWKRAAPRGVASPVTDRAQGPRTTDSDFLFKHHNVHGAPQR